MVQIGWEKPLKATEQHKYHLYTMIHSHQSTRLNYSAAFKSLSHPTMNHKIKHQKRITKAGIIVALIINCQLLSSESV